jgi:hypothetical protein
VIWWIKVPKGFGEPVFDKLEAQLAHAMLSIPATKAFEIGSGFQCASMLGSQHNDPFVLQKKTITCVKNDSGGTLGVEKTFILMSPLNHQQLFNYHNLPVIYKAILLYYIPKVVMTPVSSIEPYI